MIRYSITVKGIVQGVGFRPHVYRLAKSLSICGFVQNTSEGVYAEIEGEDTACEVFITALKQHPPVLAKIKCIHLQKQSLRGESNFIITESVYGIKSALISPDIGICDACKADITDKNNRRYQYAFTNCTDCGPRFSIILNIPYDRKNTTMSGFAQCPDCLYEYEGQDNRRFHAQPNACPVCGPELYFYKDGERKSGNPYELFDECIKKGGIAAVKGLGGYNFVCDAENEDAVAKLRKRKIRYDKPFAVMIRDIDTVKHFCFVDAAEEKTLLCAAKPIVLLKKNESCFTAENTAPNNGRLGVMLPYTPLHCILIQNHKVLIMTSANISDRPMIYDDGEAMKCLFNIADAVLTHNRKIERRIDDSVCFISAGKPRMIRRARGYVPEPLRLKDNKNVILALGAQQKSTFCFAKGEDAFLSEHIGDLDDMDTECSYKSEIESYKHLFDAVPNIIACDMHPDYISTRYADRFNNILPIYRIQHHHAHFASVLAEHNIDDSAIGLIFDGTGFGNDETLWGGEALRGDISTSERIGHMLYAPLLGGEAAIREPWRMALALISISCGEAAALDHFKQYSDKAFLLLRASEKHINSPLTSGAGRLFDAVAALAGVRTHATYEGQAAIELEHIIDDSGYGSYGFDIIQESDMMIFDWRQLIRDIINDSAIGISSGIISAKFHRAVIQLIADVSSSAKKQYGSNTIVLSGGVFQNEYLLRYGTQKLEMKGFNVYTNDKIPSNDGGISYGQAAAASRLINKNTPS
ncbi:MAG: carbamoyltransferase HypF [Eubacteriales bacterium]